VYDPTSPTIGNSNVKCEGEDLVLIDDKDNSSLDDGNLKGNVLDWLFTNDIE